MGTHGKKIMNPRIRVLKILEYLKENTDENHRIKPADIRRDNIDFYNEFVKSKVTFGRCIYDLADFYSRDKFGYRACFNEWKIIYDSFTEREIINTPDYEFGENEENFDEIDMDNHIRNLYYKHPFSYEELDQIIMGIHLLGLDADTSKDIINRLTKNLSSKHYQALPNSVTGLHQPNNVDRLTLSNNLKLINEALGKGERPSRKISFVFCGYNLNKELVETKSKPYTVSPFDIVCCSGRYYLIANTDGYNNMSIWRIDLMRDLTVCSERAKQRYQIKGMDDSWRDKDYYEHLNMFFDEPIDITLKVLPSKYGTDITKPDYTFLYDYFGKTYKVMSADESGAIITVKASKDAMVNFALQYSDCLEIIKPVEVRNRVIKKINNLAEKYMSC